MVPGSSSRAHDPAAGTAWWHRAARGRRRRSCSRPPCEDDPEPRDAWGEMGEDERTDPGGTLSASGIAEPRDSCKQINADAATTGEVTRPGGPPSWSWRWPSAIRAAMTSVIEGKPEVVRTAITVLLAEGHLLIEDVPGVGKTMLAKALARSIDCTVRRIQFTPDLLPSDITGVSVFNQDVRDFEFRPGAIFANVVVGDEINRASPKTQSALLESHGGGPGHRRRHDLRPARSRSSSWPPRTRSRWRAPTRSPRRSATGSWRGSRWATPRPAPRSPCSTRHGGASPLERLHAGHRRAHRRAS